MTADAKLPKHSAKFWVSRILCLQVLLENVDAIVGHQE